MARKPAAKTAHDLPPEMDYAQHEATWRGFVMFVKWAIISMGFLVVSLYCFIEAHQPVLGLVLLLAVPVLFAGSMIMGRRRA